MDPKAALISARAALLSGEHEETAEFLGAYQSWRIAGGFMPEVSGRAGDEEYRALSAKLLAIVRAENIARRAA